MCNEYTYQHYCCYYKDYAQQINLADCIQWLVMDRSDDSKDRVGYLSHAIERSALKPGDHIYVRRFPWYTHHGVYTGDPKHEVIHLSGETRSKKSDAKVQTCSLDEFLDGGQLRLVAYGVSFLTRLVKLSGTCHSSDCRTADRVLKTANFYFNQPDVWGEYDLIVNNCEHFSYYCKTRKNSSAQVEGSAGLLTSLRYDEDTAFIKGDCVKYKQAMRQMT